MDERARRIEGVEAAAFTDLGQAADGLADLGLRQQVIDGALVSAATGDHHFLINRVNSVSFLFQQPICLLRAMNGHDPPIGKEPAYSHVWTAPITLWFLNHNFST